MQRMIQSDLRQFREFLSQQDHQGDLTPEDALDLWRCSHPFPDELKASAAEVQQTLDEMRPDSGVLARDASAEIRSSLDLRAKS